MSLSEPSLCSPSFLLDELSDGSFKAAADSSSDAANLDSYVGEGAKGGRRDEER